MPHLKKAELIDGVVYMGSPVSGRRHGRPTRHVSAWLGVYEASTPGVFGGDSTTVRLDLDNESQPDALLMIEREWGGQASISDDDYIEGAPELVVEVASSSVSRDLHSKLRAYRRAGVREYLVWRVRDQSFEWLALRDEVYQAMPADERGILKSVLFPGLWLDAAAMLDGNLTRVLEVLREGLASPEHGAFVARLEEARRGRVVAP